MDMKHEHLEQAPDIPLAMSEARSISTYILSWREETFPSTLIALAPRERSQITTIYSLTATQLVHGRLSISIDALSTG
jgi:hypothetical protein